MSAADDAIEASKLPGRWGDRVRNLEAENERLREALNKIAVHYITEPLAAAIAREALNKG